MNETPPSTTALARDVGRGVFGSDISGYHSARLGYPDALLGRIRDYCGVAQASVVEIGPGTGLFTTQLLQTDLGRLVAIEPDIDLASFLEKHIPDRRLTVVAAPFLEADVGTGYDLVGSACAFHWIEPTEGLAKVLDLLRPGGALALIWHSYRNADCDPFFAALQPHLESISLPPTEGHNGYIYRDEPRTRALLETAGFVDVQSFVLRSERFLDADGMAALYDSFSFIRVQPRAERERIRDTIRRLVDEQFGGSAPNLVLSPVYLGRKPLA